MNALVVYDSLYGNTRRVAEVVAFELGENVPALSVAEVTADRLAEAELVVFGSPIHAFHPSHRMGTFLSTLAPGQLTGVRVATFDTRINVFFHGDAAKHMAKNLARSGATLVGKPEGFFVLDKEGPLKVGELERAKHWAATLLPTQPKGT